MAKASVHSVNTADAGSVDIAFPAGAAASVSAGGFVVNTSLAGSVRSTGTPTGSAAATGGCVVTTIGAGSVDAVGRARKVSTRRAGSVKVDCTATPVAATGAGDEQEGGAKISWKVGAATAAAAAATAALELFDLAHGDKIRVLLVVVVGAAEVHARGGAMGRRIVYASLAMLLLAVAAWIRSPSGRILEP